MSTSKHYISLASNQNVPVYRAGSNTTSPSTERRTTQSAAPSNPPPKRVVEARVNARWWFMATCAFATACYTAYFVFFTPPGDPTVKARIMSTALGVGHIIGGGTAMFLGPIQFLNSVRQKTPAVHVWVGRAYVAAVIFSGVGAFQVSFNAISYTIGKYGFALLAALWLITVTLGMRAIWKGNVASHRRWLMRNFALTYAAVMLRWQLVLLISFGLSGPAALTITAFSSWIPNLIFVEFWLARKPVV